MEYSSHLISSPTRKAIHLPSGLHSGLPRSAGMESGLNCFSFAPAWASAT